MKEICNVKPEVTESQLKHTHFLAVQCRCFKELWAWIPFEKL